MDGKPEHFAPGNTESLPFPNSDDEFGETQQTIRTHHDDISSYRIMHFQHIWQY